MKGALIMCLLLAVPSPFGQTTKTGDAKTSGSCSAANTGNGNTFTFHCYGISEKQAQEFREILNKIAANQIDTKQVMEKLDEILHSVNPNLPAITYFCDGTFRTVGPGPNVDMRITHGGDNSELEEMARLNDSERFSDLLKVCLARIQATPGWLTPRLFCALAYNATGERGKAKAMLQEFDSEAGPGYDVEPCDRISGFLHKDLQ